MTNVERGPGDLTMIFSKPFDTPRDPTNTGNDLKSSQRTHDSSYSMSNRHQNAMNNTMHGKLEEIEESKENIETEGDDSEFVKEGFLGLLKTTEEEDPNSSHVTEVHRASQLIEVDKGEPLIQVNDLEVEDTELVFNKSGGDKERSIQEAYGISMAINYS